MQGMMKNLIETQEEGTNDMANNSNKAIITWIIPMEESGRSVHTTNKGDMITIVFGEMKIEEHKIGEYECPKFILYDK